MKRALLLAVVPLVLATNGCVFHVHGLRNALGSTDVRVPPTPLTRRTPPEDPGERGVAFHASVHGGFVAHERDVGGLIGGELGFFPYTMDRSAKSWITAAPMRSLGGAVGWSIFRGSQHGNSTFGPLYAEARAVFAFTERGLGTTRFGIGAAFNPQTLNAGPQASACVGINNAFWYVCTRGGYMFGGEGPELYVYFELASFLEYAWSK